MVQCVEELSCLHLENAPTTIACFCCTGCADNKSALKLHVGLSSCPRVHPFDMFILLCMLSNEASVQTRAHTQRADSRSLASWEHGAGRHICQERIGSILQALQ